MAVPAMKAAQMGCLAPSRRARRQQHQRLMKVARASGSRAANGYKPNSRMEAADSQYCRGGFSK
jgi:hypothetical protein